MKKYFKLFEECYIVSGKDKYTLYNVLTGNIYEIDEKRGKFCLLSENNMDIENACNNSGLLLSEAKIFIKEMESATLGMMSDFPIAMDKLNILPKWTEKMFFKQSHGINKATIGMDYDCSNSCSFCGNDAVTNRYKCWSCNSTSRSPIADDVAFRIIDIISERDCKELYLKEGDLLSDWGKTLRIVDYALNRGIEKVLLNIIHPIDDMTIINDMRVRNISLVLQRYIEKKKQIELIMSESRKYEGLDVTYILLTELDNKETIMQVAQNISQMYSYKLLIDFMIPNKLENVSKEYFDIERIIGKIDLVSYSIRQFHNECFYKNCYFDKEGNVYPCAGLKNRKYGDIDSMPETFRSENLGNYWNMSLSKKQECKECSMRFACNNCESLNYTLTGSHDRNVLCVKTII